MTLWMFGYDDGSGDKRHPVYYMPFYAVSEEDVERRVQEWIAHRPYPVARVSLKAYPHGFQIARSRLPGKTEV